MASEKIATWYTDPEYRNMVIMSLHDTCCFFSFKMNRLVDDAKMKSLLLLLLCTSVLSLESSSWAFWHWEYCSPSTSCPDSSRQASRARSAKRSPQTSWCAQNFSDNAASFYQYFNIRMWISLWVWNIDVKRRLTAVEVAQLTGIVKTSISRIHICEWWLCSLCEPGQMAKQRR